MARIVLLQPCGHHTSPAELVRGTFSQRLCGKTAYATTTQESVARRRSLSKNSPTEASSHPTSRSRNEANENGKGRHRLRKQQEVSSVALRELSAAVVATVRRARHGTDALAAAVKTIRAVTRRPEGAKCVRACRLCLRHLHDTGRRGVSQLHFLLMACSSLVSVQHCSVGRARTNHPYLDYTSTTTYLF
ncbi:hypothetical protein DOTSEDRAFT_69211, partial [Dothistroma septosporum NZE10]